MEVEALVGVGDDTSGRGEVRHINLSNSGGFTGEFLARVESSLSELK